MMVIAPYYPRAELTHQRPRAVAGQTPAGVATIPTGACADLDVTGTRDAVIRPSAARRIETPFRIVDKQNC